MSFLGNIIWLVTSFFVPIGYLIGGIILFPLLPFIYPVIGYSFLPFGREIVSTKYLEQFKDYEKTGGKDFDNASGVVRFLANIVWVLTFGWILALLHIIVSVGILFKAGFNLTEYLPGTKLDNFSSKHVKI